MIDIMKDELIVKEISSIISEFKIGREDVLIELDSRIFYDLGIDSLSFIALLCRIEDRFHIYIPEERIKLERDSTVHDLVKLISECQTSELRYI